MVRAIYSTYGLVAKHLRGEGCHESCLRAVAGRHAAGTIANRHGGGTFFGEFVGMSTPHLIGTAVGFAVAMLGIGALSAFSTAAADAHDDEPLVSPDGKASPDGIPEAWREGAAEHG